MHISNAPSLGSISARSLPGSGWQASAFVLHSACWLCTAGPGWPTCRQRAGRAWSAGTFIFHWVAAADQVAVHLSASCCSRASGLQHCRVATLAAFEQGCQISFMLQVTFADTLGAAKHDQGEVSSKAEAKKLAFYLFWNIKPYFDR